MRDYLLLFMFVCLSACGANDLVSPEKRTENSVEALAWLKARVKPATENVCTVGAVETGSYQGQTVYLISVGGLLCRPCAGQAVNNQAGELVLSCNLEEEAKIMDVRNIWLRP